MAEEAALLYEIFSSMGGIKLFRTSGTRSVCGTEDLSSIIKYETPSLEPLIVHCRISLSRSSDRPK